MLIQNAIHTENHVTSTSVNQTTHNTLSTQNKKIVQADSTLLRATPKLPSAEKQPNLISLMHNAFTTQKQELAQLPSSSNDKKLAALDVLEKRGFKPASTSVLEIPLTGKALGGMPKRVNAILSRSVVASAAAPEEIAEAQQIREQIIDKRTFIEDLQRELNGADAGEVTQNRQLIHTTLEEIVELHIKLQHAMEQARRTARGNAPRHAE